MTLISNEELVMGSYDTISQPYICEVNQYTEIEFKITDAISTSEEPSDYKKDIDFSVLIDGKIDWYNHKVQEIVIERSEGASDTIDPRDISTGYFVEQLLSVASTDGFYDTLRQYYTSGTSIYRLTTDYLFYYTDQGWVIDWTPSATESVEPPVGSSYKIALLVRIPKSDHQPLLGDAYFCTYNYWAVAVPGDFLCRDSFYTTYDENNPSRNQLQHYGLDLQDSVNFWRSYGNQNNLGNMDKAYPGSLLEFNYDYYLSRYAVINYTSSATVTVSLGASADNPSEIAFDESSSSVCWGLFICLQMGLIWYFMNLEYQP